MQMCASRCNAVLISQGRILGEVVGNAEVMGTAPTRRVAESLCPVLCPPPNPTECYRLLQSAPKPKS
jgi:hypothetical protein